MNKIEEAIKVIENTFPVDKHRPLAYNNSVRLVKDFVIKANITLDGIKNVLAKFKKGSINSFDAIDYISNILDCLNEEKDV